MSDRWGMEITTGNYGNNERTVTNVVILFTLKKNKSRNVKFDIMINLTLDS